MVVKSLEKFSEVLRNFRRDVFLKSMKIPKILQKVLSEIPEILGVFSV